MEDLEICDVRFRPLVLPNARLHKLFDGMLWAEGPVWMADGDYLVCSDIPNNRMLRWVEGLGVGVFRQPSNFVNGNTRDREGRLMSCEHGGRRVVRTEPDGCLTVLVDSYRGRRLNSPNDVVVKSDGTIWFTDPPYGILSDYEGYKAEQEQDGCYVFRFDPRDGSLDVVADDFMRPNGLAFSPDERVLYIADSAASHDPEAPRHIRAFDVADERRLRNGRVFAETDPGVPDGLRVDTDGRVWTSAGNDVRCYHPDGTLLGRIGLPEAVANLTFGGPRRNRLFITATTSVYSIYLACTGVQRP